MGANPPALARPNELLKSKKETWSNGANRDVGPRYHGFTERRRAMANRQAGSSTPDRALSLDSVLNPRSIAVVGASRLQAGVGGFGASFLRALKEMRFPGPIYPVNPKYEEIEGLKCYPRPEGGSKTQPITSSSAARLPASVE